MVLGAAAGALLAGCSASTQDGGGLDSNSLDVTGEEVFAPEASCPEASVPQAQFLLPLVDIDVVMAEAAAQHIVAYTIQSLVSAGFVVTDPATPTSFVNHSDVAFSVVREGDVSFPDLISEGPEFYPQDLVMVIAGMRYFIENYPLGKLECSIDNGRPNSEGEIKIQVACDAPPMKELVPVPIPVPSEPQYRMPTYPFGLDGNNDVRTLPFDSDASNGIGPF